MAVLAMSLLVKDVVASPIRMRDVTVEISEDVEVVKAADGSLQTTGTILSTETVTNGGQAPATSAAAVSSPAAVVAEKEAVKAPVTSAAATTSAYVAPTTTAKPATSAAATSSSKAAASTTASSSSSTGKKGLLYDYYADKSTITSFFTGDSSAGSAYTWSTSWCANSVTFPSSMNVEQVPQLWGLRTVASAGTDDVGSFDTAAATSTATHYMGFNEPDQCGGGGSCISVADAQTGWATFASKYHGKKTLVSPSVTNGSGSKGLPWLSEFLAGSGIDSTVDVIGIHWYGGSDNDVNGACTNLLSQVAAAKVIAGSRDVWLTEFQYQGTDVQGFLKTCAPQLDGKDGPARYAYNLAGGLISTVAGALAAL